MKKCILGFTLIAAGLLLLPEPSEACWWWRRCRPAPCPPAYRPVVVYPTYCPPVVTQLPVTPAQVITIGGKTYTIEDTGDPGSHAPDELLPLPGAVGKAKKDPNTFFGKSRAISKTTIFDGPVMAFISVNALLDSLPSDQDMRDMNISRSSNSQRVMEEQRNVAVTCFIYAYKKEPDNDYHVIIGDAPGTPNLRFFNVEVSGIPMGGTAKNRDRLLAVRNTFKNAFELGDFGPGNYRKPNPSILARVSGSLFWDVDHSKPPFVGPASHRPQTAWEIHPVSDIEFLP